MTKVLLVRHGETDWNREEIFRGRIDVELNGNGRKQALALAEATAKFHIDTIYSSPLSRSMETAKRIAEIHHLDVNTAEGFIDLHYGEWQGLNHRVVEEKFPELYRTWHESPHLVHLPGGESLENVWERSLRDLRKIITAHEDQTVLIAAHRVVNKVLLCGIMGLGNSHFWRIQQSNCCLNIFEYSGGEYIIHLLNDTCHLRQIATTVLESDF